MPINSAAPKLAFVSAGSANLVLQIARRIFLEDLNTELTALNLGYHFA
jgi:hypothetical protein